MRQSEKEMTLQRGLARLLQPVRRESGGLPAAADELAEFASAQELAPPRRSRVATGRR